MNYSNLKKSLYEGLVFQKPTVSSVILKLNETNLAYSIGKKGKYKKVDFEVLESAHNELMQRGILNRKWFTENYPMQSKNSPCNFTTLGGLLQHFNLAIYNKGEYIRK
ncbi:hypothetical protein ACIQ1H_16995 [Lysinibacillus sp. NPDC097279]|uniref:hypothetical protein n=1 Tax=Lysinibacillus sp. NPDC097279 TaxID=3364143 RepID=UPI0037F3F682